MSTEDLEKETLQKIEELELKVSILHDQRTGLLEQVTQLAVDRGKLSAKVEKLTQRVYSLLKEIEEFKKSEGSKENT